MAYFPILGDIIETRVVAFDSLAPSQLGINVMHWRTANPIGGGVSLTTFATRLDVAFNATYKLLMGNGATYRGVSAQKIWPAPRTAFEFTIGNLGPGVAGANMAPAQVSGLVRFLTARAGRAFRGRQYIPFPAVADVTVDGNVSVGYEVNLGTLASAMSTIYVVSLGLASTTFVPVIYHPKGYGTPPVAAHTTDDITSASASPLWATIRRRGNYGRLNPTAPF